MDEQTELRLEELVLKSAEGIIEQAECRELEAILSSCPEALEYYSACVELNAGMQRIRDVINKPLQMMMALETMAAYENAAPSVHLAQEEPRKELIQKVIYERNPRKVSRFTVISAIVSVAAIVLLVLLVKYIPEKQYGVEVATLVDQVNVKWVDSNLNLANGDRLLTNKMPIALDKGVIEIRYDDGVQVLIEGPAKFGIQLSGIYFEYGRLFSRVPATGLGFLVETPTSRFIDMGTEFGVQADVNGSSELHVFKGKVQLFAGSKDVAKSSLVVTENKAARYNANSVHVNEIPIEELSFARSINSASSLIWRGQKSLDLADIVGGGCGTGSGLRNSAIQWDGQGLVQTREITPADNTPKSYVPVRFSPFIDGIFIPSSRSEAVKLSSNTAQLDLDEFLRRDTNGLVTLMLIKENSDQVASYWIHSRESAGGDRTRMPFLCFPKGSNGQPAIITTADGQGADTYVSNDALHGPGFRFGAVSSLHCRYWEGIRARCIFLRFDIRQVEDLSAALLNLSLVSGNRNQSLSVYGLKDGADDFWDEETINYNASPGLKAASAGYYEFDPTLYTRLGTFKVSDTMKGAKPIVIASDGLTWAAPQVLDQAAYPITNADSFADLGTASSLVPLRLGGKLCGGQDNPSILMHANAGITFNLDAIRREYGPLKSFTASCGLSPSALGDADVQDPCASFYVLLDGREVFSAEDLTPGDDPRVVELRLTDAHYLTFITTQGGDGAIDNDLCLFAKPTINIE